MRPVVLLWENFGPYHRDRLRAVQASGRPAIGIQFAARSDTYAWDGSADAELDLRTLLPPGRLPGTWTLLTRLLAEARRIGPADWLLCHYQLPAVFLAACLLRLRGRRVFAMGDSKFDDYPRRLGRELGKALLMLPYRGALTATRRSRDYLRFLGIPAPRIALGYNGVAVDRVTRALGSSPAPDSAPHGDRDWIVIARLVPKKNVALAIRAHALWLQQTASPRDLHLLGNGPLEAELRALADELGVAGRVRFHGFVQADAVAAQLSRSMALLLPSIEEQFGLTVNEALAAGLPVLATPQVGACDVLIDGGLNGFILPADAPERWAAAMLQLSEDEATWRRYAEAAREAAPRGDVAQFVAGVDALLGPSPGGQHQQAAFGHAAVEREDRPVA